jgi:serralysin
MELRYVEKAGDTFVYGDVEGDGKADFTIHRNDPVALVKGDFFL